MASIRLTDAAHHYRELSHQIAAWNWLQEQLSPQELEEFAELYRAAPPPKPSTPPGWLAPALKLIRHFEGCRLEAYRCPAGVPTVGYGTTRMQGRPVRMGDTITQAQAEELLTQDLLQLFGPGVLHLVPAARGWSSNRVATLVSFSYNVGLYALETSTLRKRLLAGDDPDTVVREELPKWRHAGEAVVAGLERRRAAEVELFCGPALSARGNPLRGVPYFSQRDSAAAGQAGRMCFSSSCAMLAAYMTPGALTGPNADDDYLQRLKCFGDTTEAPAQLKALESYGVRATFTQSADWADIERQINRGIPVPIGILHHGTSSAPKGGGHWILVYGINDTHATVMDPFGELDLVNGGYLNSNGNSLRYSRRNLGPRWLVEGPRSGWAIIAEP